MAYKKIYGKYIAYAPRYLWVSDVVIFKLKPEKGFINKLKCKLDKLSVDAEYTRSEATILALNYGFISLPTTARRWPQTLQEVVTNHVHLISFYEDAKAEYLSTQKKKTPEKTQRSQASYEHNRTGLCQEIVAPSELQPQTPHHQHTCQNKEMWGSSHSDDTTTSSCDNSSSGD